jgi:hypothetical protein
VGGQDLVPHLRPEGLLPLGRQEVGQDLGDGGERHLPFLAQEADHCQNLDVAVVVEIPVGRHDFGLRKQSEAAVVVDGGNGHSGPFSQFRDGDGALATARRPAAAGYIPL